MPARAARRARGARDKPASAGFFEQALPRRDCARSTNCAEVLTHALEQLEGLVTNWSPVGLATLRSKMAVAIIEREHIRSAGRGDAEAGPTSLAMHRPPECRCCRGWSTIRRRRAGRAYAALGTVAPRRPADVRLLSFAKLSTGGTKVAGVAIALESSNILCRDCDRSRTCVSRRTRKSLSRHWFFQWEQKAALSWRRCCDRPPLTNRGLP